MIKKSIQWFQDIDYMLDNKIICLQYFIVKNVVEVSREIKNAAAKFMIYKETSLMYKLSLIKQTNRLLS